MAEGAVLMTTDLKDLKELAEAAIEADKTHTGLYPAGVWQVVEYGDDTAPGICVHSGDAWRVCFMATIQSRKDYEHQMAKAQHIAGASPQTVLELIARVEAVEGAIDAKDAAIVAGANTIHELRTALEQAKAREAELRSALERLSGILLKHEQEARSLLDYEEDTGISDMREALIAVVFNDDGQDFLHTVRFAENAVTAMGGDDNG